VYITVDLQCADCIDVCSVSIKLRTLLSVWLCKTCCLCWCSDMPTSRWVLRRTCLMWSVNSWVVDSRLTADHVMSYGQWRQRVAMQKWGHWLLRGWKCGFRIPRFLPSCLLYTIIYWLCRVVYSCLIVSVNTTGVYAVHTPDILYHLVNQTCVQCFKHVIVIRITQ